jgi:hypothetical protein
MIFAQSTPYQLNFEITFVLIRTNIHRIEIYSAKSFKAEPLFSLQLRSSARVHSTSNDRFYILTSNGIVYSIAQQVTSDKEIKFDQTDNTQLNISCSMMLTSMLTLDGLESLVVVADNGQSITIRIMERIIYIDIDV